MLEDNVRAPVESCASLVTKAARASEMLQNDKGIECHFRFIGWLGSLTNLEYLLCTHSRKRAYPSRLEDNGSSASSNDVGVFPFPQLHHLAADFEELEVSNGDANEGAEEEQETDDKSSGVKHSKPGGNFMCV